MLETSTLKPGLLVSLKTSLRGNVAYQKVDLEREHKTGDGSRARWETTRTTADIAEHEAAIKARGRAVAIIRAACSVSAFGLLCPESDSAKLESAIAEARRVVDEFNSMAKLSRINLYVIAGKITADDVEAVRAINSEVRDLLDAMARGVKALNAKAIRDAANKATQLGQMLSPEAKGRVNFAIEKARQAARQIVKSGETAAREVDRTLAEKISEQRLAFLDLDDAANVERPESIAFAVDLEPEAAERTESNGL